MPAHPNPLTELVDAEGNRLPHGHSVDDISGLGDTQAKLLQRIDSALSNWAKLTPLKKDEAMRDAIALVAELAHRMA